MTLINKDEMLKAATESQLEVNEASHALTEQLSSSQNKEDLLLSAAQDVATDTDLFAATADQGVEHADIASSSLARIMAQGNGEPIAFRDAQGELIGQINTVVNDAGETVYVVTSTNGSTFNYGLDSARLGGVDRFGNSLDSGSLTERLMLSALRRVNNEITASPDGVSPSVDLLTPTPTPTSTASSTPIEPVDMSAYTEPGDITDINDVEDMKATSTDLYTEPAHTGDIDLFEMGYETTTQPTPEVIVETTTAEEVVTTTEDEKLAQHAQAVRAEKLRQFKLATRELDADVPQEALTAVSGLVNDTDRAERLYHLLRNPEQIEDAEAVIAEALLPVAERRKEGNFASSLAGSALEIGADQVGGRRLERNAERLNDSLENRGAKKLANQWAEKIATSLSEATAIIDNTEITSVSQSPLAGLDHKKVERAITGNLQLDTLGINSRAQREGTNLARELVREDVEQFVRDVSTEEGQMHLEKVLAERLYEVALREKNNNLQSAAFNILGDVFGNDNSLVGSVVREGSEAIENSVDRKSARVKAERWAQSIVREYEYAVEETLSDTEDLKEKK